MSVPGKGSEKGPKVEKRRASSGSEGYKDQLGGSEKGPVLDDPELFINREYSWLKLNERIFEEAMDPTHPLLERIKFLAICGSNLDEFFMVRVSGVKRQVEEGALSLPVDGMAPVDQIKMVRKEVKPLLRQYSECWSELVKELDLKGIHVKKVSELNKDQRKELDRYFREYIFPTLTPLAMDFSHPFPFISNLSLNLAVVIEDPENGERFARVKVPNNIFPRFFSVPSDGKKICGLNQVKQAKELDLVLLEDMLSSYIDMLFPGLKVAATYPFRTTRDAEIEISKDQASDLLTALEEGIESRRVGRPVRLEIDESMPDKVKDLFAMNLGLTNDYVYKFVGPLGLVDMWQLLKLGRSDLKDEQFLPYVPAELSEDRNLFSAVSKRDYVFYYPYDSFNVIVNLLRQAAEDKGVLAIKTTMYRIDKDSPIIDALLTARENDKAVSAIVELKAKFDEENNMTWAKALEEAGVHVVYGLEDLKVHCKICIIIRKEGDEITRYSYISTGNFNAVTSKIYGDIGYLTSNPEIGMELTDVFNLLTGYSKKKDFRHLLLSPMNLKEEVSRSIEREIEIQKGGGTGYIGLKLNGLLDASMVRALYKASNAGVRVDLNVRALCALRPGIKDRSENIRETSIIGRFLEHARIYHFRNNGDDVVLIGSSDLMPRNLYRRVEVLLRVPDPRLRRNIIEHMLKVHLRDNVKSRLLKADGTWDRVRPGKGEEPFNSQKWLIEHRGAWHDLS
ncbi:MAG: polyphosphate kinase 1 [Candidatus Thermoplasmatota archaeon]|nr:polyphosphate kinase 1 [Candidatus Thermoplasmatota archaeon]